MKKNQDIRPDKGLMKRSLKRTPMILGLSVALLIPCSYAYSEKAETGVLLSQSVTQAKQIKGQILDETGEPMIGVSVLVKGTNTGAITDVDGNFTVNVPTDKAQLEISYIGYKSQSVSTSGQVSLKIKMQPNAQALDEVVVVGYGTVKKRDLTGAIASVKNEDLVLSPASNPMETLQGKVAGFDIVRTSGKAGAGVSMTVRGNRTLSTESGANDPLFIIDGMPGNYSTLNPNDIESVEVLKDASSTAIYGSAGSNGVVIITTKAGKEGKPQVNFNAYLGINGFASYPKARTGEDYLNLRREASRTTGNWSSSADDSKIFSATELDAIQNNKWVDWEDLAMHTGVQQNYSVSVNGGNENTKAYFSFNYSDEQGIFKNDNSKIYSLRSNIDQKINKWLSTGINLQVSYTDANARKGSVLSRSLTATPLGVPYDENGNINTTPIAGSDAYGPLNDEISGAAVNNTNTTNVIANGYAMWKPFKGFSIKSVIGATLSSTRNGKFNNEYSLDNENLKNKTASVINSRNYNYKWENIVNYSFKVADDHEFSLTGVTSWNHDQYETYTATATGMDMDKYLFYNLSNGSGHTTASNYTMSKMFSYVARVNYSYLGKYIFSLSNRWDGASRLAEGKKWDSFPAAAAAWRISDEDFMKGFKNLSNLKLRVGYGVTGSSRIGAYGTVAAFSGGNLGFQNNLESFYQFSQSLASQDLGWEKSYNTNIGLDLGLYNNRISLALDVYNTDTKDVLYNRTMPATMGGYLGSTYKMWQNICQTNNKGIEILLTSQNIIQKNFKWSTTFTFAKNKEKITKLLNGQDIISENLFLNNPVNTFYSYKILGIWQTSETEEAAKYGKVPGDIKLYDKNKDFKYTSDDKVILGSGTPSWTGGLQNNFTYHDFDLSVFLYARWGQMMKSDIVGRYDPQGKTNSPAYFNYWTPENASNDFPRPNANSKLSGYFGYEGLSYVDGSFLKIKNITLGYTLPKELLAKASMSRLRLYATISNPFVFAKSHLLKSYDPEMGGSDEFPLTKQIVFGVNVTF